jgi:CMP-N-acetylneuraminic acid synthetase
MKVLGVITARGGSKRLPGKNLADLGGRPLIAWTIEVALATCDMVVVSTDSPDIKRVSLDLGATVIDRPQHLAQDSTPSLPVVVHAVKWAEELHGPSSFDAVMVLQPTSPFRTREDVKAVLRIMELNNADAVVSVVERSVDGLFEIMPGGAMRGIPEEFLYACNGAIYLVKTAQLANGNGFYDGKLYSYIMPIQRSLDIDTRADIDAARVMIGSNAEPRLFTNKKETSPV